MSLCFVSKKPLQNSNRCKIYASALFLFLAFCSPAYAIPSPDLVINMFASAAQLLGLGAALLGAGLMSKRKFVTSRPKSMRRGFYIVLTLFVISLLINIFQYSQHVDERNERLQTNLWRSSVENGQNVGDASLKTLRFSDQISHPQALSTEELQTWRNQGKRINIVDVRESEEIEQGTFADAYPIRYPDVRLNPESLFNKNSETIFMCYSGNRSSELCSEFTEQGYSCKFVVGGFEKWIAENRALSSPIEDRAALREIPNYEHRDTLLDTKQVYDYLAKKDIQFIDVRYANEFNNGHLPGAINMTLRAMTSKQIDSALTSLSKTQTIIAPCYDKRSCFYAQILGLKLTRIGIPFLGRYTTPHEFTANSPSRNYVTQWQDQRNANLMQVAATPFKSALQWLTDISGSLMVAIFILVCLVRIVIAPVTIKSDRDNIMMVNLSPKISEIKSTHKETPRKMSKKILALYKKHRLTPGKNLIGTSIQIVIFMLIFFAVQSLAQQSTETFLWLPLAKPDTFYILPALIALLIYIHCKQGQTKLSRVKISLYIAASALIFVLCLNLPAATNLYLFLSVSLLFIQAFLVRRWLNNKNASHQHISSHPFTDHNVLPPLLVAAEIQGAGNKAINLSRMLQWGLPVPNGFIIPPKVIQQGLHRFEHQIYSMFDQLGAQTVVTRSSGANEDGTFNSHAGIYETRLNVVRQNLMQSLNAVAKSYKSERAQHYAQNAETSGCIVVQEQVNPDYAGVLFTESPVHSGQMILEYTRGLADDLVSGRKTPSVVHIGRISRQPLTASPPFNLHQLLSLAHQIEHEVSKEKGKYAPQDIEWACKNGQFYIIQTRDITETSRSDKTMKHVMERERFRLLRVLEKDFSPINNNTFIQNELSEVLPKPTPISLSLMRKMWNENGCVDLACQRLGIDYDIGDDSKELIHTAYGRLYVDQDALQQRCTQPGTLAAFRLSKMAGELQHNFHEHFLPEFNHEMSLAAALDFNRIDTRALKELLARWIDDFAHKYYVEAEVINIATNFYMESAQQALIKKGLDPNDYLIQADLSFASLALKAQYEVRCGNLSLDNYCDQYGHRSHHDYELAEKREYEDLPKLEETIKYACNIVENNAIQAPPLPVLLAAQVKRALDYQNFKEEAKHYCMKPLANIRRLLMHLDTRLQLQGHIFYLTLDELMTENTLIFRSFLADLTSRKQHHEQLLKCTPPASISLSFLEQTSLNERGQFEVEFRNSGAIKGQKIAGKQSETAPIRVLASLDDISTVKDGEIIVVKNIDPELVALLPKIKGIISETGGMLSHMAILAREFGKPTVSGVKNATRLFSNGQSVYIRDDGLIERRVKNRRTIDHTVLNDRRVTADRRAR